MQVGRLVDLVGTRPVKGKSQPIQIYQLNAVLRDVSWFQVLAGRRQEQHERVARALEAKYGVRAPELADVLAHHYGQTPRAEKAAQAIGGVVAWMRSHSIGNGREAMPGRPCRQAQNLRRVVWGVGPIFSRSSLGNWRARRYQFANRLNLPRASRSSTWGRSIILTVGTST